MHLDAQVSRALLALHVLGALALDAQDLSILRACGDAQLDARAIRSGNDDARPENRFVDADRRSITTSAFSRR